ncbi:MAG: hypothetical protein QXR91_07335 [Nitrososphaerales archaeon]
MGTRYQSRRELRGLLDAYKELRVDGDGAYIRLSSLENLKAVDAIVFDCDGVLIDARRSYDAAIRKSIQHIFTSLTGCRMPLSIIPIDVIYNLRLSGGFNFDWDSTYVITLMLFTSLPKDFQKAFSEVAQRLEGKTATQRLVSASSTLRGKLPKDYFQREGSKIKQKLKQLTETKIADKDAAVGLLLQLAEREGYLQHLRDFIRFLNYPSEAKQSIISTVFDEFFYGAELFKQIYGFKGELGVKHGLIEKEERIVSLETLKALTEMLGEGRLGLATGRGSLAAKKTLGEALNYFNSKAMVFLEDLKYKMGGRDDLIRPYVKPEPYSLLEAVASIGGTNAVLYVGNSSEDFILVNKANKVKNIFLFAGCYALQNHSGKMLNLFAEAKAEMILPTVNALPKVLKVIKGEQG